MTLRLFTLQAHYRKPLDFTAEALEAAATGWKGLNAALRLASATDAPAAAGGAATEVGAPTTAGNVTPAQAAGDGAGLTPGLAATRQRFAAAMDDDLNTSAALAVLFELARPLRALANRLERGDTGAASEAAAPALRAQGQLLLELAAVLGLKPELEAAVADQASDSPDAAAFAEGIEAQIAARQAAKASRDFASADRIRDALKAEGIELIDKPGGLTEWRRL
jgi:cysteinyl-tRNA synthetase